ncbi:MAG: hypothetical protein AAB639_03590 [Patescibacteria group bacterium]
MQKPFLGLLLGVLIWVVLGTISLVTAPSIQAQNCEVVGISKTGFNPIGSLQVNVGETFYVNIVDNTPSGTTYTAYAANSSGQILFSNQGTGTGGGFHLEIPLVATQSGLFLTVKARNASGVDCNNQATVSVFGPVPNGPLPLPPPPSDPCTIFFTSGATKSEAVIFQDQAIEVSIGGSYVRGDFYNIKVNNNVVARSSVTLGFRIPFNILGTYSLTGWHETTSGERQCSGDLTVHVTARSGGGGPGSGKNPCDIPDPNNPGNFLCPTAFGNIPTDPAGFATQVLRIATGLAGGLALILMVIGSVRVLTSSGDQQRLSAGRDMIVGAVAGLLFLIFSVLILRFIGVQILGL